MADYGLIRGDFQPDGAAGGGFGTPGDNGRVPRLAGIGPPSPFQLFQDADSGGGTRGAEAPS